MKKNAFDKYKQLPGRISKDELIILCEKCLRNFDKAKMTMETHVEQSLDESKITQEEDRKFVEKIVFGTDRHYQFLKTTAEVFLKHNNEAKETDFIKYLLLSYLAMIHLRDININRFQILVQKLFFNPKALFQFLNFLFDEDNVHSVFFQHWQHVMDASWLKDEFIPQLFHKREEMSQFLDHLDNVTTGSTDPNRIVKSDKSSTKVEPFNLTIPKVRPALPPEKPNTPFKVRDLPETTFKADSITENMLQCYKEGLLVANIDDKMKRENQKRAQELYENSQPLFGTVSSRMDIRAEQNAKQREREEQERRIQEERECEEHIERTKGRAEVVRRMLNKPTEIKLNTAAILREDALYRKQQQKEAKVIEAYEQELRDTSEFDAWKQEMDEKDEEERLLKIERRKLEMMLTDQRAREARKKFEEETRVEVQQDRENVNKRLEQVRKQIDGIVREKKEKAEIMNKELQKALHTAKKHLDQEKLDNARHIRKESKKNKLRVAEQCEQETNKKQNMIMQIKALERAPILHMKQYDPTETGGHDLLSEMSISELKARLNVMKQKKQKEETCRRQEILEQKKQREALVREKTEKITRYRQLSKRENAVRRANLLKSKWKEKIVRERERDTKVLELQVTLAEQRKQKQEERKRLEEEAKIRQRHQEALGADKNAREQKYLEELARGRERQVKEQSRRKAKSRDAQQRIKDKEQSIRENNAKTELQQKKQEEKVREENFQKKQQERKEEDIQTKKRTQEVTGEMRAQSRELIETRRMVLDPTTPGVNRKLDSMKQQSVLEDNMFAPQRS